LVWLNLTSTATGAFKPTEALPRKLFMLSGRRNCGMITKVKDSMKIKKLSLKSQRTNRKYDAMASPC
jgi:hypothetical protein